MGHRFYCPWHYHCQCLKLHHLSQKMSFWAQLFVAAGGLVPAVAARFNTVLGTGICRRGWHKASSWWWVCVCSLFWFPRWLIVMSNCRSQSCQVCAIYQLPEDYGSLPHAMPMPWMVYSSLRPAIGHELSATLEIKERTNTNSPSRGCFMAILFCRFLCQYCVESSSNSRDKTSCSHKQLSSNDIFCDRWCNLRHWQWGSVRGSKNLWPMFWCCLLVHTHLVLAFLFLDHPIRHCCLLCARLSYPTASSTPLVSQMVTHLYTDNVEVEIGAWANRDVRGKFWRKVVSCVMISSAP